MKFAKYGLTAGGTEPKINIELTDAEYIQMGGPCKVGLSLDVSNPDKIVGRLVPAKDGYTPSPREKKSTGRHWLLTISRLDPEWDVISACGMCDVEILHVVPDEASFILPSNRPTVSVRVMSGNPRTKKLTAQEVLHTITTAKQALAFSIRDAEAFFSDSGQPCEFILTVVDGELKIKRRALILVEEDV